MVKTELPLAVVSGGAHRLGRLFALALGKMGYVILLHYHRSTEKASAAAGEIRSLGVPVILHQADLTVPGQIEALFAQVDEQPYRLQILVNSAAVMIHSDLHGLSAADWDSALDLNLRTPFLMAQQAVTRMTDGGLIVNVTDAGAGKSWTGFPAYTVSKAGLEALTRVQAKAYAPKVRVNAIAPGLVLPSEGISREQWKKKVDRLPLKQSVRVDDLMAALEFLVKNESITGQTIVVDDGYSLL